MKFNKQARLYLAAATFFAAATPVAATASAQSTIAPGTQVVDPSGGAVGTVIAVSGSDLTVRTDRHEILLPASSFTPSEGKLLFAMTRTQLNSETDKALAAAEASLVAGTAVHGSGGALIGQIEAIDEATVTVKLTSGELVRMPRSGIAPAEHGAMLGVTADELKAMAAPATTTEPADSAGSQ